MPNYKPYHPEQAELLWHPEREVSEGERQRVRERLQQMQEMGEDKLSLTDPEARLLRARQGFELGYTGEIAVSEGHLHRVRQG